MENSESYWKELYFKTYSENRQLRMKLETLEQAYTALKRKYKRCKKPPSRKSLVKRSFHISHSVDLQRTEIMAQAIIAPGYDIEKLQDPKLNNSLKITPTNSKGSTKAIKEQPADVSLFEELFILTVNSQLKSFSVVGRYPNSFDIPAYSVLPDYCFPTGTHVRQIVLTESGSELNNLLYSQDFALRNENYFVFTLKPQEIISSKQYPVLDVLYFCCIVIDDLCCFDNINWVVPKCFCLVSYFPFFNLHFELLNKLLNLIRIRRMEEIGGLTASVGKFSGIDLNENEINILEEYRTAPEPEPGTCFRQEVLLQEPICVSFAKYYSVENEWICGPLCSLLKFEELFWLWNALLLEKSIVVVSSNLGILTSTVLALKNFIKPFVWPHVMLPIVPDSLRELLEAPVPLLIGIPAPAPALKKSYTNIIWVDLDEPISNKKIHAGVNLKNEVFEAFGNGLKHKLKELYKPFNSTEVVYQPNELQCSAISDICELFEEFLNTIYSKLSKISLSLVNSQELVSDLLPSFDESDHKFLKLFLSTQTVMANITLSQF